MVLTSGTSEIEIEISSILSKLFFKVFFLNILKKFNIYFYIKTIQKYQKILI